MKHVVTWFELPVADMRRAKAFYATVMHTGFMDQTMEDANGQPITMAVFAHDDGAISGMLIQGATYQPNATGSVVYLNGGDDLDMMLTRVCENGGEILVPKTPIENGAKGWFAQFLDCEGNRVGLYSLPQ